MNRPSILLLVVLSLICGCDSRGHRKEAAVAIRALAAQVRNDPNNLEALRQMETAANSSYRFERCYALGTLGDLGKPAVPALPTIRRGLLDADPFVRDAAAHAVFDMAEKGADAKSAADELVEVVKRYVNESAAMYAIRALGEIGIASPEVLEVLRFAERATDSISPKDATEVLNKLTAMANRKAD